MENLETFTGKILNDESGTNMQTLFVKKIAGKCRKGKLFSRQIITLSKNFEHNGIFQNEK
jgi:hypothetical protein